MKFIGSNLARMEINVALQEWLARIPQFRLDPTIEVKWSGGAGAWTAAAPDVVRLSPKAAPSQDTVHEDTTPTAVLAGQRVQHCDDLRSDLMAYHAGIERELDC